MVKSVALTDAELALLDGRVRAEVQTDVDAAKRRLAAVERLPDVPPAIAAFAADVVSEAEREGRLVFQWTKMSHCRACDRAKTYHTYRSGRRRGEADYRRPIYVHGVELARRFVRFEGMPDLAVCDECWKIAQPVVAAALADVRAAMPEAITGHSPAWVRHDKRRCTACGWEGHEGEMGHLHALFGGTYPGRCPGCGAENLPLGKSVIETVPGFVVVAAKADAHA